MIDTQRQRTMKADSLALSLRSVYTYGQLNRFFVERQMDAEFEAIGRTFAPDAPRTIQIWLGYELAIQSPYFNKR